MSTEAKIKIGKINDKINSDKCTIHKDGKAYKLIEKKSNKEESRYTGTPLIEQQSKYLIFKINPDLKSIDILPADEWFSFKKDITYNTLQLEDAEQRMKSYKSGILDTFLKNKTITVKKEKKVKEESEGGRQGRIVNMEESDEEDRKFFKAREVEEKEEEEHLDKELKEIPSDIEVGLTGKDKNEKLLYIEESESEEDSDDSYFGKRNDENSDVEDDEMSEIDEESDKKDFLGHKRKSEPIPIEESLSNLLSKNKKMTITQINKELLKFNYNQNEINTRLTNLLSRMCSKYEQDGEYYYFKKFE